MDDTQNTQQVPAAPVDPMANAQVPDLPTTPAVQPDPAMAQTPVGQSPMGSASTDPMSTPAPAMDAMQQMASVPPVPPVPAMDPVGQSPMGSATPVASPMPAEPMQQAAPAPSSLGPVTMEDLMEELQHIEDKLDEMDEKL